jgi:outer membrane protein TolC
MMRILVKAAVLLACSLCFGAPAWAGEPAPVSAGTATLEACLERGMARAEREGLFDSEVAAAKAGVDEARSQSALRLNVTPGVRYNTLDGRWLGDLQANLGDTLLEVSQNRVRRGIAEGRVTSAGYRRERMRSQYAAGIVRAYAACLRAQGDLDQAGERARLAEEAVSAWSRLDAGTRALVEQREKASLAARDARDGRDRLEEVLVQTRRRLATLTGMTEEELGRCREPESYAPAAVSLERCLAWAREHRSDLARARHEAGLMEQAVRLARMDRWPKPRLSFGYTSNNNATDNELSARLAVEVPLWDAGQTSARAAELSAQSAGLRVEADSLEAKIAEEVTQGYLKLREATHLLENAARDLLPAREAQLAEVRWKNGEISRLEYDESRLGLFEQQGRIGRLKWECLEAEAELQDVLQASREELSAGLPAAPPPEPAAAPPVKAP